ncbi:DNA invertase Pin-like site-specific DNA recombinase [Clostridium beijerinckii]|uniref:recombinase family protein n=1 Tax=Clostridium beijerinckii TaxID=1520 RepID=UPI001494009D|nr:recombinase family protein [Clostridium beijerinckii]NOW85586.1 DNA invertase Pin-like site-specific DNA recombinase [Clostridium beijerinckii]
MKVAIYSRKSIFTGKGDSIENQIELCKEYCNRNYINEKIEYIVYEDEGFSGGNINRPEFKQLLKDARVKKFDALICYRLDRISRNVADFSATLELLQSNNIDFISIKEQFDTSTPMGRAMVYISSVFAQLERETIAERVRDNMLQLAKTGRWLGGQVPLGFESEKTSYLDDEFKERILMRLIPNQEELELVKLIFNTYLIKQSITHVAKKLSISGIKGKNGGELKSSQISKILKNPVYIKSNSLSHEHLKNTGINVFGTPNGNGYLTYNKTKKITVDRDITEWIAAVGQHKGIIDAADWIKVQNIMDQNKVKKTIRLGTGASNNAILSGILKCAHCGANMIVKHGHPSKNNPDMKYDYYICSNKKNRFTDKCDNPNIRVDRLDSIVLSEMKSYNDDLLIQGLNENIAKVDTDFESEQIRKLNTEIEVKQQAAKNLVKRISVEKDDSISDMFRDELKSLNDEIKELQNSVNNIESDKTEINTQVSNIELVIDALKKFNANIDILDDPNQKRLLVQTVASKVLWDGKEYTANIKILGMDDSKKK